VADPLLLDVERLTFGFDALAHHGRQVVFVPHAAPGDRVAADVVEQKPGYLRARLRSVVAPGPARVVPGCRYFPLCGGCQWQQVAPAAQRDAKAAIVAEQLARLAGVRDVDVRPTLVPSGDWGYRSRISLVVEGRQAGYHRARSHRLLEVADCPIAEPVVAAHLDAARAWVARLRVPLRRVTIVAAPGGVVLVGRALARPGPADLETSEALLAGRATVRGTVVAGGGARLVAGDATVRLPVEAGLDLEVPADAFTQVSFAANPTLAAAVLAAGAFRAGERVLDLYCGAGNLSLPAARRGTEVEGIERDAVAIAAADANARRLGLKADFRCAPVADALRARTGPPPDAVILDPPRQGAVHAIAPLVALRPRRIVYVSCDPATLARDVRPLVAAGWRLRCVQPIDVFPQTYHIECVAELHLT
jgi:23S rRNA (uracil1939-C5)-methyltransferase